MVISDYLPDQVIPSLIPFGYVETKVLALSRRVTDTSLILAIDFVMNLKGLSQEFILILPDKVQVGLFSLDGAKGTRMFKISGDRQVQEVTFFPFFKPLLNKVFDFHCLEFATGDSTRQDLLLKNALHLPKGDIRGPFKEIA